VYVASKYGIQYMYLLSGSLLLMLFLFLAVGLRYYKLYVFVCWYGVIINKWRQINEIKQIGLTLCFENLSLYTAGRHVQHIWGFCGRVHGLYTDSDIERFETINYFDKCSENFTLKWIIIIFYGFVLNSIKVYLITIAERLKEIQRMHEDNKQKRLIQEAKLSLG